MTSLLILLLHQYEMCRVKSLKHYLLKFCDFIKTSMYTSETQMTNYKALLQIHFEAFERGFRTESYTQDLFPNAMQNAGSYDALSRTEFQSRRFLKALGLPPSQM